jgi:hypothetical protein
MERLIIFRFTYDQLNRFRAAKYKGDAFETLLPLEPKECAWCMTVLTSTPEYINSNFKNGDDGRIGQFCELNICKFAFDKYYNDSANWEEIRIDIYKKHKKVITRVQYPNPPQRELIKFGGRKTFEEYKQDLIKFEKNMGL